jgi:hypothetical protein
MTAIRDYPPVNYLLPLSLVSPSRPVEWEEAGRGVEA